MFSHYRAMFEDLIWFFDICRLSVGHSRLGEDAPKSAKMSDIHFPLQVSQYLSWFSLFEVCKPYCSLSHLTLDYLCNKAFFGSIFTPTEPHKRANFGKMGSFFWILSIAYESTLNFLQNMTEPKKIQIWPLDSPPISLTKDIFMEYHSC